MSGSYEPDYWKLKSQRLFYWFCIVKFKEKTIFAKFPKDILNIITELIRNLPTVESGEFCKIRETIWRFNGTFWVSGGARMRSGCSTCFRPFLLCNLTRTNYALCPNHIPSYIQSPVEFIE